MRRRSTGDRSRDAVDELRDTVYTRDAVSCVVVDTAAALIWPCHGPRTLQHRISRGMGGSALFDTAAHLIAMCNHHNTIAETDAAFAGVCRANGWTLPRNRSDVNPELIPVLYWDGWHELDDQGFRTRVYGPHAEERIAELWRQPKVDAVSTGGDRRG
ncbi:hypothetical protein ACLBWP_03530 [Microbacterium sp. M1A1_1b]